MAQISFGSNASPSLPNLDLNFTALFELRELISSPGYTAANPKGAIDSNFNLNWGTVGGAVDRFMLANVNAAGVAAIGVNNSGTANAFGISSGYCYIGTLVMPMAFSVNGVYVGQFDASGRFMVGTASASAPNAGVVLNPAGQVVIGNNAQASGFIFQQYQRSTVAIGSITQSGTTAVLYNTTSDARLKSNIADAPDCGEIIDAINVRSHDWAASGEHVTHSFIAQELAAVAPQAVKVGDSGPVTEESDIWGVDPSKLVALLVKEVQSLRARVAALEA